MKITRIAVTAALTLLPALAAPVQEFQTSAGVLKLTPIQHASLMIEAGGKILYLDPAMGNFDGRPQADYILITDIHGDHLAPPTIAKLKKASTEIVAPKAVAAQLPGTMAISYGETRTLGPFTVQSVAAYNLTRGPAAGKLYHDKGRGCGYILDLRRQAVLFLRRHRSDSGNEGAEEHRRGVHLHEPALHDDAGRSG